MWLFTNDFKHRHIIYHWKTFFYHEYEFEIITSIGSNQLAKFVISARKSMSMTRAFSLQTEGTIMMRRPIAIGWNSKPVVGVARDGVQRWETMAWPCLLHVSTPPWAGLHGAALCIRLRSRSDNDRVMVVALSREKNGEVRREKEQRRKR